MAVHTQGRSASLSLDSTTYVEPDAQIRPLRDQIIIEPLDVDHGTRIIVIEETKPVRGIVKAVGPGHWPKRYDHNDKHKRTKEWDRPGAFLPTQVKVGDIIQLGSPQGARGYNFQSFQWGTKIHLICAERDVIGIEKT